MRRLAPLREPAPISNQPRNDWQTIVSLLPYLATYKWRVAFALSCLIGAKVANLGVPIVMKRIVDSLASVQHLTALGRADHAPGVVLLSGVGLLVVAYAVVRLSTSLFTELREILFSKVTESAVRQLALKVFRHLHALSLRFHLERQTGGMSRDIERGTRGITQLISYSLYSILPTLVEVGLVLGFFVVKYEAYYAIVTLIALAAYVTYTVKVTEWRTHLRRTMNELDSRANSRAIDSLLNFETVKYFGNEEWEARRYDENLKHYRAAAIRSQNSLSALNFGQQAIIGTGLVFILWRATQGVMAGRLTLGDLVLINTFMLQLYIPLNFLGVVYRELKQSLTDMDRMFTLLGAPREVADVPRAPALAVSGAEVRFSGVNFGYEAARPILHDVSFTIPAGTTTAVVGHSGSGKSTLARLLFRFYDLDRAHGGSITIDGQDIRDVTQDSLRAAIGIVPQDTVLFNDTIYYNIAYGRPEANRDEVIAAARAAHIHEFIESLPRGYDTPVGERGLKLSGGEKQRVAIARTLLKNPPILLFDEATSALDSRSERAIQHELDQIARERTTLIIAHRLSTVVHAQQIIVMDRGRIVERGTYAELIRMGGLFAQMWALQQQRAEQVQELDAEDAADTAADADADAADAGERLNEVRVAR
ncbi:ABC transporter ATP-binding protein/permease [Paraburkholderia sp. SARCC-3016]|uniref:ABCB family ABC transporter ATP-binding protein/permease n=1 Tax=Paraburkholderia sp. SARCC-3016 TaxID=3058611 RepID=UPI002808F90E|nr:ABC transporter ATP-binding protein/permease [Paraburkholderia sp. SARCC-3016]MDQ7975682.1 ABC transporter ATP-binding protein/permease [Paraburkholderia sp. SARCC-3016]